MKDKIKIQARLNFWDRFIILQGSATVKGMLFVYIILFIAFGSRVVQGDVNLLWYKIFDTRNASGYVTAILPTHYNDNGGSVHQYFYSFQLDGETHFGDSYTSNLYDFDEQLNIEYLPSFSNYSRIYGSQNAPYDGDGPLVGFLLATLLLLVARSPYKKMKQTKKLLKDAYLISANLISSEPYVEVGSSIYESNTVSTQIAMYTLTYEYEWEGQIHHTSTDTEDRYLFPEETDLLVSASNSEIVVLVNCLPDSVAVNIRKMKKSHLRANK